MAYSISAGIAVSTDNVTWYPLTDHNRAPINISMERIEQSQRMADGTMRKYVIANKNIFDTSWSFIPAATQTISSLSGNNIAAFKPTVDGNYGAGFIKAFYETNVFNPIYIKLTHATDTTAGNSHYSSQQGSSATVPSNGIGNGIEVRKVFITNFSYDIIKRFTLTDYVDVKIQFTEV